MREKPGGMGGGRERRARKKEGGTEGRRDGGLEAQAGACTSQSLTLLA